MLGNLPYNHAFGAPQFHIRTVKTAYIANAKCDDTSLLLFFVTGLYESMSQGNKPSIN